MIRDHVIATIKYRYRAQYRQEDDYGNGRLIAERGITDAEYTGLFPHKDYIEVWFAKQTRGLLDVELVSIETKRPDVVIFNPVW